MSILNQFIRETEVMAAMPATNVVSFREVRAKRIRELGTRWTECTLELGKELSEVKDTFPTVSGRGANFSRPNWEEWLNKEVGIGLRYSESLIQIWEKFGRSALRSNDVKMSFRVLQYLARETVPESARTEVIDRAIAGEVIGKPEAEKIAKTHAAPPPAEARKIAKETGKPTLARDGNIYLGATKAEEKDIEDRRRVVFDVRRSVETLSGIEMTPNAFLKYALPHQLWNHEEEHQLDKAAKWLSALVAAWGRR